MFVLGVRQTIAQRFPLLICFDLLSFMKERAKTVKLYKYIDEKTKREYFQHSNLVYSATFFAFFAIIPLFYFSGSIIMTAVSFVTMLLSILVTIINRRGHHGLASFIFITTISLQATLEVILFGLEIGFQYYFFNMAVLIVFVKWSDIQKMIGILFEIILFIGVFVVHIFFDAVTPMPDAYAITFHVINILLNLFAVASTSLYFFRLAREAGRDLLLFAQTDYLTKLPNRAAFHEFVEQVQQKAKKYPMKSLVMLMIDIDRFKETNDAYGHATGDFVLVELGKLFSQFVQSNDFLARYGGEEFIMIHFEDDPDKAREYAETIRLEVESRKFRYLDYEINLTVSIGALYKPNTSLVKCDDAITQADTLLYKAKTGGRNLVVFKTI